MFIFNALCCISEPKTTPEVSRSRTIKRAAVDTVVNQNKIQPQITSDSNLEKNKENLYSTSEEKVSGFPKSISHMDSFKSDDSYVGSDQCSLEYESPQKQNFQTSLGKRQNDQNKLDFVTMKRNYFLGCEFIDRDVKLWSIKEVLRFLGKVGLKQYHNTFYQNKIKGKDLISLSQKQLKQDLQMTEQDTKTLREYIEALRSNSERQRKQRPLSRTFSSRRKPLSLYKTYSQTYSCQKILSMISNPIVEEDSEEDGQNGIKKSEHFTNKEIHSVSNFSELLSN